MLSMPSDAARSMMRLYSVRPAAVEMSIWKSFSHQPTLILTELARCGAVIAARTHRCIDACSASSSGCAGGAIFRCVSK